ncbi:MAG: hypothetical protein AMXMBFR13_44730 [Phycisphaerae bacterium]
MVNGLPVTNGLLTVVLNDADQFGPNPFTGEALWLEITIDGTPLSPRQALSATPFAVHALHAANADTAGSAALAQSVPWSGVTGVPPEIGIPFTPWTISAGGPLAGWGDNSDGQIDVPSGKFITVAAGSDHILAIRRTIVSEANARIDGQVSYYFKEQDRARNPERNMGFIAQDVEPVLPNLVSGRGDAMRSLDYSGMSVVAIGGIQELRREKDAELREQQAEIASLRNEVSELRAQLAAVKSLTARLDAIESRLSTRVSEPRLASTP